MQLLVSNDDGIFSLGVRSLANALAADGHHVTVVCPDRERSATGHSLTLHQPIRAERIEDRFDRAVQAWSCSGTPSDCVKLALGALLDSPPDLVLSGINHGSNIGTDILYSGTVSAAMEGIIEGIGSIAFSLASFSHRDFKPAVKFARKLVDRLATHPLPDGMLLNVNIPAVPEAEIVGVTLARQGVRRYTDLFQKRTDPRGKTYYWLAGEVLEEVESESDSSLPTDVRAIQENYITLTPLQYNLTCLEGLEHLQSWDGLHSNLKSNPME
ncbi:MAG: 5'/3'-nucleotidase SurE [Cyanobacteriota bacterium]|nr:5'/3'-nucleotidase SurE [Cyanobacteriota bacterium]